jgi:hypothetical protein
MQISILGETLFSKPGAKYFKAVHTDFNTGMPDAKTGQTG